MARLTAKQITEARRNGKVDALSAMRRDLQMLEIGAREDLRTTHKQISEGRMDLVNDDSVYFLEGRLDAIVAERERVGKMIDRLVPGPK